MDKIPAHTLPDSIAADIAAHLRKFSAFSSTSLVYFGVDFHIQMNITLYARGEEKVDVDLTLKMGEHDGVEEELDSITLDRTRGAKPIPRISPHGELPIGEMTMKPVDPDAPVLTVVEAE